MLYYINIQILFSFSRRNAKKSEEKLATLEKDSEANAENIIKLKAEFQQVENNASDVLKKYEKLTVSGTGSHFCMQPPRSDAS